MDVRTYATHMDKKSRSDNQPEGWGTGLEPGIGTA